MVTTAPIVNSDGGAIEPCGEEDPADISHECSGCHTHGKTATEGGQAVASGDETASPEAARCNARGEPTRSGVYEPDERRGSHMYVPVLGKYVRM